MRLLISTALAVLSYTIATTQLYAQSTSSVSINFASSTETLVNPERGFWTHTVSNFVDVTEKNLQDIRAKGVTVVQSIVRLDAYRATTTLPSTFLTKLDGAFDNARKAGVKVIVRFVYNFPTTDAEWKSAKDAKLSVVLNHIGQVAPIVNENKDVLVIMQAGFIGAWGEQHGSTNGLDTAASKLKIRDKLLDSLDSSIAVQWRYPIDIFRWIDDDTVMARTGFNNDCFLSSLNDGGTYNGDLSQIFEERGKMMQLTKNTYFSGETCNAEQANLRKTCGSILLEGAQFHLSSLNLNYYTAFHDSWRKEGCFTTVQNKMGYRFALVSAKASVSQSNSVNLAVRIKNDGWARLYKDRKLTATFYDSAGQQVAQASLDGLSEIEPGSTKTFDFDLTKPRVRTAGRYLLCLSAMDPEPLLNKDARYAIRFANAVPTSSGITFDPKSGRHCSGVDFSKPFLNSQ